MKLKRIISALLVFTMVMACSVCAVSANGTYQVTTSYDVSTKEITVNAALAGAAADSMVSYLIVKPVTTEDGTSYEVSEDGSNILHIDQATANGSGAATYETAKIPFSELENAKVKFVSSASETLTPFEKGVVAYVLTDANKGMAGNPIKDKDGKETGEVIKESLKPAEYSALPADATKVVYKGNPHKKMYTIQFSCEAYTKSVTKFNELQKDIVVINGSDSGKPTKMYYVTKDGEVLGGNGERGNNFTAERWDNYKLSELFDGDLSDNNLTANKQVVPLDDVVAWMVVISNTTAKTGEAHRETASEYSFIKIATSFSGDLSTKSEPFVIYNNYNEYSEKLVEVKVNDKIEKVPLKDLGRPNVDLTINGIYKDDVKDGKFGNITLEGGDIIKLYKQNTPVGNPNDQDSAAATIEAMTIDADPIYGTFTSYNNGIEYPSVTFLVTATDVETANKAGLRIRAYPKGSVTFDETLPPEGAASQYIELGICPNANTGTKNFAIQLFDSANQGYLNPDEYDLVATPVINDAEEGEDDSWTVLSPVGEFSDSRFFTVKTRTTATEVVAE